MRNRPFYLLAVSLFLTATVAGLVAQDHAATAASSAANATAARRQDDYEHFRHLAEWHLGAHQRVFAKSLIVFALGSGAWLTPLCRKERGLQSVPFLLLVVTSLVHLILV